jgi:hypothetical protein
MIGKVLRLVGISSPEECRTKDPCRLRSTHPVHLESACRKTKAALHNCSQLLS